MVHIVTALFPMQFLYKRSAKNRKPLNCYFCTILAIWHKFDIQVDKIIGLLASNNDVASRGYHLDEGGGLLFLVVLYIIIHY